MEGWFSIMVRIRISIREYELLRECFYRKKIDFNFIYDNKYLIIETNELQQLELIIDIINDKFIQYGLTMKSEPNKLGKELEDLNNKFINQLQLLNK